jgi:hypothetical protein
VIRFVLGVLIGASVAAAYAQSGSVTAPIVGTVSASMLDAVAHGISPKGDWLVIHTDAEGRVICAPEVKP